MMKTIRCAVAVFLLFVFLPAYASVDYSIILKRNIFAEPPPPPKPEPPEKTPIMKPLPPPALTSLIDLKGIIYFPQGGSFAVMTIKKSNEEVIYKEGDIIANAEIAKVSENEVVFVYNGKEERIELKKDTAQGFTEVMPGVSAKVDVPSDGEKGKIINPTAAKLPKFEEPVTVNFDKTMAELRNDRNLMKNLNVAPNLQDGKIDGFKINNIPAGSLPYQYGLRDGDVLRSVNGTFIDSMAKGFSVYNQIIRDGTSLVTVEVLRNNAPVVLTFKLR